MKIEEMSPATAQSICPIPSNKEWREKAEAMLLPARVAWLLITRSKKEALTAGDAMAAIAASDYNDAVEEMRSTADFFRTITNILELGVAAATGAPATGLEIVFD